MSKIVYAIRYYSPGHTVHISSEGQHWVVKEPEGISTSKVMNKYFPPGNLLTFETVEEAHGFMEKFKGHPYYVPRDKDDPYTVVSVIERPPQPRFEVVNRSDK